LCHSDHVFKFFLFRNKNMRKHVPCIMQRVGLALSDLSHRDHNFSLGKD
jgi:hypothetical protein